MDRQLPVLKPHITELNATLLRILSELQTIKIQQQEFIKIIEKDKQIPTNVEVSKGWFGS
tara:strand:- start:145 stop:324 length:180 start_codon:yes stop_codon:yes gene_type:complete